MRKETDSGGSLACSFLYGASLRKQIIVKRLDQLERMATRLSMSNTALEIWHKYLNNKRDKVHFLQSDIAEQGPAEHRQPGHHHRASAVPLNQEHLMKLKALLLLLAISSHALAVESLTSQEMSEVTGGRLEPEFQAIDLISEAINRAESQQFLEQDQVDVLFAIANLMTRVNEALDYTLERVNIQYGDREPIPTPDGEGLSLLLPVYMERVTFRDMRPDGADENSPTMGTVHFEGIRFSDDAYIFVYER